MYDKVAYKKLIKLNEKGQLPKEELTPTKVE